MLNDFFKQKRELKYMQVFQLLFPFWESGCFVAVRCAIAKSYVA